MVKTSSSENMSDEEIEALSREKSYMRVYALLISAAEERKTATYGDVAAIMGLPSSGQYMSRETGRMLAAITHREHVCERPMLSAVVVSSVDKRPGEGFYKLVRKYGRLETPATRDAEREFWKAELERVYEEWSS